MLCANMGITILPSYLTGPLLTRGKLNAVPLLPQEEEVQIAAVWSQENLNPSLHQILPYLG